MSNGVIEIIVSEESKIEHSKCHDTDGNENVGDVLFSKINKFCVSWNKWCSSPNGKENIDPSIEEQIYHSATSCIEWQGIDFRSEFASVIARAFGKSIDTLNEVEVSSDTMETTHDRVENVLQCISNREDSDKNLFDFLAFINMFAQIRYVCAYFVTRPKCNLHDSNGIDENEKTGFLNFVNDCSRWLYEIDNFHISYGYRFAYGRHWEHLFECPEHYFDADIYKRHMKDKLIWKDAFRSENKTELVTQIDSIVKSMCRQTCRCDSMKTLSFILYFANIQGLLSYT